MDSTRCYLHPDRQAAVVVSGLASWPACPGRAVGTCRRNQLLLVGLRGATRRTGWAWGWSVGYLVKLQGMEGGEMVVGGSKGRNQRTQLMSGTWESWPLRTDRVFELEYRLAFMGDEGVDNGDVAGRKGVRRREWSSPMFGVSAATRFNIPRQRPNCGRHAKTRSKAKPTYKQKLARQIRIFTSFSPCFKIHSRS